MCIACTQAHKNETKMATVCKLVTSIEGHAESELRIAPLKGYLLSASPTLLAVHNVSGLYSRTRDDPTAMLGRPLPPSAPLTRPSLLASTREKHIAVGSGAARLTPDDRRDIDAGGVGMSVDDLSISKRINARRMAHLSSTACCRRGARSSWEPRA